MKYINELVLSYNQVVQEFSLKQDIYHLSKVVIMSWVCTRSNFYLSDIYLA